MCGVKQHPLLASHSNPISSLIFPSLAPTPAGSSGNNSLALLEAISRQIVHVQSQLASPFGIPPLPNPISFVTFPSAAPSHAIMPNLPYLDVNDDLPEPFFDAIKKGCKMCGKSQVGKKVAGQGRLKLKEKVASSGGVTKWGK